MNFLQPWGLLGLAALIPIIALYFLKLKREERVVPSTLLWKKVIDDMQVNSPFQRLKYSLLLLIQMLLIALLGFALARPYLSVGGYAGTKRILLIDTSASMGTRDGNKSGTKTRLDAAVADALAKVDEIKQNDGMQIIAFDKDVRQLTKMTADKATLRQVLSSLEPRDVSTNAEEAFETALALCDVNNEATVLVLSDGCFGDIKILKDQDKAAMGNTEDVAGKSKDPSKAQSLTRKLSNFKFVSYGDEVSDNVAITQMDARTRPVRSLVDGKYVDMQKTQVFIMVENFAPKDKDVMLTLSTSVERFSPKMIRLKGRQSRQETAESAATGDTAEASRSVEVMELPLGVTGVVTAHIDSPKDKLPVDDTASVVIGGVEGSKVLLVSKGNFFLEKALGSIKGLEFTKKTTDEFSKEWDQKGQQTTENFDACIFDESAPLSWTDGGALFIGAMPPLPGFSKKDKPMEGPQIEDWDSFHPVMRYVNFSNVAIAKAQAWTVPKTAKQLVEGNGGPLVVATETDRSRVIGIAFDIFSSDWVYRRSLPLFIRNAVPWLAEASPRHRPTAQHSGDPLAVPPIQGAKFVTLVRPDGNEKVEVSPEHTTFLRGTEKTGLYYLKGLPNNDERVFAVNLASRGESDNAARPTLKVADNTVASSRAAIEAKREVWKDLAVAALALLAAEWWIFHRRIGI